MLQMGCFMYLMVMDNFLSTVGPTFLQFFRLKPAYKISANHMHFNSTIPLNWWKDIESQVHYRIFATTTPN